MPVVSNEERGEEDKSADDVVEVDGAVTVGAEHAAVEGSVVARELSGAGPGPVVTKELDLPVEYLHAHDSEHIEHDL